MSNIRKVARIAGVSTATVSRALTSPERVTKHTLDKVMVAVAEANYRPNMMARNFRSERAYSIVILVPSIDNPFYSRVIRGAEQAAQERGYSVLLGDARDSIEREREYINLVETRLADGVIQFRPSQNRSTVDEHQRFPIVYAAGCENTPLPSVRIDNVGASSAMVDYLVEQGHRRIAVLCGSDGNPHTVDRLAGYRRSLERIGLEYDPELVISGQFSMASGVPAGLAIARMKEKPTALFCMNDEMAIGAVQGLRSGGLRVPEDISVAGFDNIDFAMHCDPPLTTIEQPSSEIGRISGALLIDMIEGGDVGDEEIVLPHKIVVRGSTPPRSSP